MLTRTLAFLFLVACTGVSLADEPSETGDSFRPKVLNFTPPLLTESTDLDQYVGRVIAIRGQVSNTKIPTILGIDVVCRDDNLRGKDAYAVGILTKWTMTKEQLSKSFELYGPHATRGPGTSYVLYHSLGGTEAPAKAWPDSERRAKGQ